MPLGVLLLLMGEEFNERAVNERLSAAALWPLMCATFSYRKMIVKRNMKMSCCERTLCWRACMLRRVRERQEYMGAGR
jgi:hypothetical protein